MESAFEGGEITTERDAIPMLPQVPAAEDGECGGDADPRVRKKGKRTTNYWFWNENGLEPWVLPYIINGLFILILFPRVLSI